MKVLVAEDDAISRRVLCVMLEKWGYEVQAAEDGVEALEIMRAPDAPRLAILDWMMPHMDGVEVIQRFRGGESECYTYIILLTAKDRTEDIVTGMKAGADDYIVKPFDNRELQVRLNAARRLLDLQAELLATQEALRTQAMRDPLTNALNRRAILDHLDVEIDRARRKGTALAVIMIDIDHFKSINDTYGHAAGDEVLRTVVKLTEATLRSYDRFGRYGGEEFLVVIPQATIKESSCIAERIRRTVETSLIPWMHNSLQVTLSLGVATHDGLQNSDMLIHAADAAMYHAKRTGRNRVQDAASLAAEAATVPGPQ